MPSSLCVHTSNYQSILSFVNTNPAERRSSVLAPPKPDWTAPGLPLEVWLVILQHLTPITIKAIRLVCSSWSRIGLEALFDTAYLDSFHRSWLRLGDLSRSYHANRVKRIIWKPRYLPPRALDAEGLQSEYPNLLVGLSHSEYAACHPQFRSMFFEVQKAETRSDAELLSNIEFTRFISCQDLVISGDQDDIESLCSDPAYRRGIQCDKSLLANPAIWGLSPRRGPFFTSDVDESNNRVHFGHPQRLISKLPALTRLELALPVLGLNQWGLDLNSTLKLDVALYITVHHFYCRDTEHTSAGYPRLHLLPLLEKMPNIRSLLVRSIYTGLRPAELEIYKELRRQYLDEDDYSEDSCETDDDSLWSSSESATSQASRVSQIDTVFMDSPAHIDRGRLDAMNLELIFGFWPCQNLKRIALRDVTFNAQDLIAFLCDQKSQSSLSVELHGDCIIHGCDPQILHNVVKTLGIDFRWVEDRTLFYVSPEEAVTMDSALQWHALNPHVRTQMFLEDSGYWEISYGPYSNYDWEFHDWVETYNVIPSRLEGSGGNELSRVPIANMQIVQHPSHIRQILSSRSATAERIDLLYAYVGYRDQNAKVMWVYADSYNLWRDRGIVVLLFVSVWHCGDPSYM